MVGPERAIAIPLTVAAVTPDWLSGVFAEGGHQWEVESIVAQPIGVGVGIMSLLFRLTPSYVGPSGPATVVVKIAPPYEQVRAIAAGYGMYQREVEIYRGLGPELSLRPPHCYFASYDSTNDSFVIVIDDLGGLRSSDQIAGCSIDDATTVVGALAMHHAQWWNSDRAPTLPFIQSPSTSPWPEYNDQSFAQCYPVILERFGEWVPERVRNICERWSDFGPVMMRDVINHPFTLCHADVRLDNVFFTADGGGQVSIVDWQIANWGPGIGDVAYFMSQSLTVENRRACERDLLHHYHEGLVAGGVVGYRFEQMWDDYRRCLTFCLTYPVTAGAGELANDRANELCRTMLTRCVAAILDTDADQIGPIRPVST